MVRQRKHAGLTVDPELLSHISPLGGFTSCSLDNTGGQKPTTPLAYDSAPYCSRPVHGVAQLPMITWSTTSMPSSFPDSQMFLVMLTDVGFRQGRVSRGALVDHHHRGVLQATAGFSTSEGRTTALTAFWGPRRRCSRQSRIASSSRWEARRAGFCCPSARTTAQAGTCSPTASEARRAVKLSGGWRIFPIRATREPWNFAIHYGSGSRPLCGAEDRIVVHSAGRRSPPRAESLVGGRSGSPARTAGGQEGDHTAEWSLLL